MDTDVIRAKLSALIQDWITATTRGDAAPFVWGQNDCMLRPADFHVAAGLPDPAAPWRGKYRTMLGAYRLMRGSSFIEILDRRVAKRLGWKEYTAGRTILRSGEEVPNFDEAQPGDIGVMNRVIPLPQKLGRDGPNGIFLADVSFCVIRGPHGDWHGPTDRGLTAYPDHALSRAWNILP